MQPISIRAFARRQGVSHTSIRRWIAADTIPKLPNGKIDPEAAEYALERLREIKVMKEEDPMVFLAVEWLLIPWHLPLGLRQLGILLGHGPPVKGVGLIQLNFDEVTIRHGVHRMYPSNRE